MTEHDYLADLRRKGYAAPVVKTWEAGLLNDAHVHGRDLYLRILDGSMTVTQGDAPCALGPGDTCEVPAGVTHSERVGADGVRFQVALR